MSQKTNYSAEALKINDTFKDCFHSKCVFTHDPSPPPVVLYKEQGTETISIGNLSLPASFAQLLCYMLSGTGIISVHKSNKGKQVIAFHNLGSCFVIIFLLQTIYRGILDQSFQNNFTKMKTWLAAHPKSHPNILLGENSLKGTYYFLPTLVNVTPSDRNTARCSSY